MNCEKCGKPTDWNYSKVKAGMVCKECAAKESELYIEKPVPAPEGKGTAVFLQVLTIIYSVLSGIGAIGLFLSRAAWLGVVCIAQAIIIVTVLSAIGTLLRGQIEIKQKLDIHIKENAFL